MGHTKDICWKCGKDGKMSTVATNYLKVLVDDEEATLEQLNKLCGIKHDVLMGARIPRRCLPIESLDVETTENIETKHVDVGKNSSIR
jgi:hypothetical protein